MPNVSTNTHRTFTYAAGTLCSANKCASVPHVQMINGTKAPAGKVKVRTRATSDWAYNWRQRVALKKPRKYKDTFRPLNTSALNTRVVSL